MNAQTPNKVTCKTQGSPPVTGIPTSFQVPCDTLPSSTTSLPPVSPDSHPRCKDTASFADVDIAGLGDTPMEDTKGTADGHTRRRSSLMDGIAAVREKSRSDKNTQPRRQRRRHEGGIVEDDERKDFSDEGQPSEFSSRSTCEDVELDDTSSDGDLDGEETGLTKEDRRRRRRRKRRGTRMNERIAGDAMAGREWKNLANESVLKRSLVNALLIGLWYALLS
jgi:solute carrier family 35 protein C2